MQVDEYARQFMEGEGAALYFDKRQAPRLMCWLMLAGVTVAGIGVGVSAVDNPGALWALAPLGIGALATVTFWSLRTVVTPKFVHVQYGVGGTKIPVGEVVSVDVVDYQWFRYGGWGIRRNLITGTVAYNMMGDQGRAVKIVYKSGWRNRTLLVSADNPERLRDAIRAAMAGTTAAAGDDALAAARASLGLAEVPSVVDASDQSVDATVAAEAVNRR